MDRAWVDGTVMGAPQEAQPPLDKLKLQTVETCEIRMEPSLLHHDLKDRALSGRQVHSNNPGKPPDSAPPLLFCFAFPQSHLKQDNLNV